MHDCCSRGTSASRGALTTSGVPTWTRRARSFVEWALPVTALALVPKCPACFAGYVLLFTGIGISASAAAAVRWTIIGVCAAVLGLLLLRLMVRLARWGRRARA
jgi:hypothetical protein